MVLLCFRSFSKSMHCLPNHNQKSQKSKNPMYWSNSIGGKVINWKRNASRTWKGLSHHSGEPPHMNAKAIAASPAAGNATRKASITTRILRIGIPVSSSVHRVVATSTSAPSFTSTSVTDLFSLCLITSCVPKASTGLTSVNKAQ